ncbi:hypothetical protein CSKR_201775 [Clonorchis sinensis]|uniref:Uncharacterized protein n=1 Tax=Clonorchis sinensis TaxID=79923 RepID=A0A8T1MXH0_CLOSI|nr:hypothetical protein CSKR_201775 [Clonorchis sinensis]
MCTTPKILYSYVLLGHGCVSIWRNAGDSTESMAHAGIFKNAAGTSCDKHLVTIAYKMVSGVMLHRLIHHQGSQIRENQAGQGSVGHILTLRQIPALRPPSNDQ